MDLERRRRRCRHVHATGSDPFPLHARDVSNISPLEGVVGPPDGVAHVLYAAGSAKVLPRALLGAEAEYRKALEEQKRVLEEKFKGLSKEQDEELATLREKTDKLEKELEARTQENLEWKNHILSLETQLSEEHTSKMQELYLGFREKQRSLEKDWQERQEQDAVRRADRLFQIVQLLRGGRVITAAELARELEVSLRTVYRDVAVD